MQQLYRQLFGLSDSLERFGIAFMTSNRSQKHKAEKELRNQFMRSIGFVTFNVESIKTET